MAILKAIVCVDSDWAIGKNNDLLYKIPEDMEFFKRMTVYNTVVMGHKTFISMGNRKLNLRKNIVLTRDEYLRKHGNKNNLRFMTTDEFDNIFKNSAPDKVYFIIGGEEIYKKYYRQCDEIYVTMVSDRINDPDKYFPDLNYCREFKLAGGLGTGRYKELNYEFTRWIKV